jgi:hypothetical protein
MTEVSKEQFRAMYFKYGRAVDGWGQAYWDEFFEEEKPMPMKYLVQEPESPGHCRMMIVSDYGRREYRMFFLTEEAEERLFDR